jgi:hypothetical protein
MKFRKIKSPATKTIEFRLHESIDERVYTLPTPAHESTPEWFIEMPENHNNEKPIMSPPNFTLKTNPRFSDPFSLGYMAVLPYDVELLDMRDTVPEEMKNNPTIGFREGPAFEFAYPGLMIMDPADMDSHIGLKPPTNCYTDIPYSWKPWFHLQTPPGYSVLITNPLNNNGLPWHTSSMVIDSDKGEAFIPPIPFFISKPVQYAIIPKGTPIFQIIPFKRDSWKRKVAPITENNYQDKRSSLTPARLEELELPNKFYTKNVWEQKKFN